MTTSSTVIFGPIDSATLPPSKQGRESDELRMKELLFPGLKYMLEQQGVQVDEYSRHFPIKCYLSSGRLKLRIDLYGFDRDKGYWTISYYRIRGIWERLFGIYPGNAHPRVTAAIHFTLKRLDQPIETTWYVIPPGTLSDEYDLSTVDPQL